MTGAISAPPHKSKELPKKGGSLYVRYAHRKWEPWEEDLLGTATDREVAELLARSRPAVVMRRRKLARPPFAVHKSNTLAAWLPHELALLGTMVDRKVAQALGRQLIAVQQMRHRRGIPAFHKRAVNAEPLIWENVRGIPAPEFFKALSGRYAETHDGQRLTYTELARQSHYSLSRMQKWFTSGSAQQPLIVSVRQHLWLLSNSWSRK